MTLLEQMIAAYEKERSLWKVRVRQGKGDVVRLKEQLVIDEYSYEAKATFDDWQVAEHHALEHGKLEGMKAAVKLLHEKLGGLDTIDELAAFLQDPK